MCTGTGSIRSGFISKEHLVGGSSVDVVVPSNIYNTKNIHIFQRSFARSNFSTGKQRTNTSVNTSISTSTSTSIMHEEKIPAGEQEQELVKAQSLAETGTDTVYNALILKLKKATSQIEFLQNDPNSKDEEITKSMQNAASLSWDLGMLDQAQELQEQILAKLMQKHSKSNDTDTDTDIDDPNINTKHPSPKHLDIAMAMHTIGSIQSRLQNPHEASKWFLASLTMKQELLSSKYSFHYEIGKTLNGLALVKMQMDNESGVDVSAVDYVKLLEEAESHYINHGELVSSGNGEGDGKDESVSVSGGESEEDMSYHPHVAALDENIAMIYRMNGDLRMAFQRYENALRIHEHWAHDAKSSPEGTMNEKITNLNMDIGDCLQGLERYKEATGKYQKALDHHLLVVRREQKIQSQLEEVNEDKDAMGTAMTGVLRHNIGMMHAQLNNYEDAMEEYEKALAIKKSHDSEHVEVAKTLNAMGALMATQGKGRIALTHFMEALRIFTIHFESTGGEYDEDVAQTRNNIKIVEKTMFSEKDGKSGIANASGSGASGSGASGRSRGRRGTIINPPRTGN